MSDDLAMNKILDQVMKLLALAAKAGTPAEAEAAAAKAQELMTKYNLDTIALEKRSGAVSGKREKDLVDGGYYAYQRWLFSEVAKLNFCLYATESYRATRTKDSTWVGSRDGRTYHRRAGDVYWKKRHRLVGRTVNVQSTKVMVNYLSAAINRVLRDRLRKSDGTIGAGQMASAWATSFREGAVMRLLDKIRDEREKGETKRAADRKRAAKVAGHSAATALTLVDVEAGEHQANYDFLHGEGAWAKQMAQREEYAREHAAWLKDQAERAAADPAYAKQLEKERRAAARGGPGSRGGTSHLGKISDYGGYNAGFAAAKDISIHQQARHEKATGGALPAPGGRS